MGKGTPAPIAAPSPASTEVAQVAQRLWWDVIWGLGGDISAGFQSHVPPGDSVGWASPPHAPACAGFGGEGLSRAEPLIRGTASPPTALPPNLHSFSIIFASPSSPSLSQLPDE